MSKKQSHARSGTPTASKVAVDSEVQNLPDKARLQQEQSFALQQHRETAQARVLRAYQAWIQVRGFRDREGDEWTGDEWTRHCAEMVVNLGKVLKADGWEGRLEAVAADTEPKKYAMAMLRQAMAGNIAGVQAIVKEGIDTPLGLDACCWLRTDLMYEVLPIRVYEVTPVSPPPWPPIGWEGSYLEAVETLGDFIRWIDDQFLIQEIANGGTSNKASSGKLVRNAYRLVDKLGLKGIPLAPTGPFTLNDELAHLGNLRRICLEKQEKKANGKGSRERSRPNTKRDEWIAKQRAKTPQPTWDDILTDLTVIAARKRWDVPAHSKSLAEAHTRYLKYLRTKGS